MGVDVDAGLLVTLDAQRVVRALSLADGSTRWSRDDLAQADGVVAGSGKVAVANGVDLEVLDDAAGATSWTASVPAGVGPMGASDGTLVVVPTTGPIQHAVLGFDLADGTNRWTVPLPEFMPCCFASRRVLVGDGRAIVADATGFLSLSLDAGDSAWALPVKDVTSAVIAGPRLVTTSNSGLVVYDPTTGAVEAWNKVLSLAQVSDGQTAVTVEAQPGQTSATTPDQNHGPPVALVGYQLPPTP